MTAVVVVAIKVHRSKTSERSNMLGYKIISIHESM